MDGVVAAELDVVARSPRPPSRFTQRRPLTPLAKSLPAVSDRLPSSELVEFGVPTPGGFSILYLRNSEIHSLMIVFWIVM